MSEQEQISQLSALFDGELPSQQAELVIRRALKDPAMRQRWQRYALIGACMRGEPLSGADGHSWLAERVATRIADEAEILAPWGTRVAVDSAAGRSTGSLFGRGILGGAIAAGVAVMAVFVVRSIGPAADGVVSGQMLADSVAVAADPAPQLVAAGDVAGAAGLTVAGDSEPRSYTSPGENARVSNSLTDQPPLARYVVAHSEQAASYLGSGYDLTEGTIVMTADEIKAYLR